MHAHHQHQYLPTSASNVLPSGAPHVSCSASAAATLKDHHRHDARSRDGHHRAALDRRHVAVVSGARVRLRPDQPAPRQAQAILASPYGSEGQVAVAALRPASASASISERWPERIYRMASLPPPAHWETEPRSDLGETVSEAAPGDRGAFRESVDPVTSPTSPADQLVVDGGSLHAPLNASAAPVTDLGPPHSEVPLPEAWTNLVERRACTGAARLVRSFVTMHMRRHSYCVDDTLRHFRGKTNGQPCSSSSVGSGRNGPHVAVSTSSSSPALAVATSSRNDVLHGQNDSEQLDPRSLTSYLRRSNSSSILHATSPPRRGVAYPSPATFNRQTSSAAHLSLVLGHQMAKTTRGSGKGESRVQEAGNCRYLCVSHRRLSCVSHLRVLCRTYG